MSTTETAINAACEVASIMEDHGFAADFDSPCVVFVSLRRPLALHELALVLFDRGLSYRLTRTGRCTVAVHIPAEVAS